MIDAIKELAKLSIADLAFLFIGFAFLFILFRKYILGFTRKETGRVWKVAEKTYKGIDGKLCCSVCGKSGFMGPRDNWRCRSPECDAEIRLKKDELNPSESKKNPPSKYENPKKTNFTWVLLASAGVTLMMIVFAFIRPFFVGDGSFDLGMTYKSAMEIRENWEVLAVITFVTSCSIFGLMHAGVIK